MNYSLNVKSSSIVHTLLSNCVKLLGKVQKLLIKCISYSVISKRIRVVSPKFYTARKNFTGPPVPTVLTNLKSGICIHFFNMSPDFVIFDTSLQRSTAAMSLAKIYRLHHPAGLLARYVGENINWNIQRTSFCNFFLSAGAFATDRSNRFCKTRKKNVG